MICSSKVTVTMQPRWKSKQFAEIAKANPMSQIIAQLRFCLVQGAANAMLSDACILLEAEAKCADLLSCASFGRQMDNCEKDKQWFQLGFEEAFYLVDSLHCLTITGKNGNRMSEVELWQHMKSETNEFPVLYKAYAHLRSKNWVVRPGTQYGADFMAYRHHPALVHSEYAVIVVSEGDAARLTEWSDMQCSVRVCGSVAKTLLVLSIDKKGEDSILPSCLEQFSVDERATRRWVPERNREEVSVSEDS